MVHLTTASLKIIQVAPLWLRYSMVMLRQLKLLDKVMERYVVIVKKKAILVVGRTSEHQNSSLRLQSQTPCTPTPLHCSLEVFAGTTSCYFCLALPIPPGISHHQIKINKNAAKLSKQK